MMWSLRGLVATGTLLLALITGNAVLAQKYGGVLKLSDPAVLAHSSLMRARRNSREPRNALSIP